MLLYAMKKQNRISKSKNENSDEIIVSEREKDFAFGKDKQPTD